MDLNPLLTYRAVLEQREFSIISKFINRNYGIRLPDHKRIMIQGRLINRLIKLNFQSFEEYTNYVFSEEGKLLELPHMVDVISTNKTEFYRESVHFNFLKDTVIPGFIETSESQTMKIWSAACSSGEEVYTIGMEINDSFPNHQGCSFSILGTDISTRMLEKAKKAVYPLSYTTSISLEKKKKYLLKSKDPSKDEVRIKKVLRDKIRFMWHNLMDQEYNIDANFDVIFCRNVLIYFSKEDQLHVLQNLNKKLKPGGYLFLGHSESIAHLNLPFKNVNQTVFQKQ